MATLVRNTTLQYSSRHSDGYKSFNNPIFIDHNPGRWVFGEDFHGDNRMTFYGPRSIQKQHSPLVMSPFNRDGDHHGNLGEKRAFLRPRSLHKQPGPAMTSSFSQRRNQARQRRIFLQTYKLASMDASRKSRAPRELKKFVVKVKSVVVSVLSFLRVDSLKSCSAGSAICASSPSRIVKLCRICS